VKRNYFEINLKLFQRFISHATAPETEIKLIQPLKGSTGPGAPETAEGSGVLRSVCMSVCVSVCLRVYLWYRWTDRHKLCCADLMAVARSSSGSVAIRYVLPVLRMTSRLAVPHGDAWKAEPLTYCH